jgi:hypothetical protein
MSQSLPEPFEYPWDQMSLFPPTHLHFRLDVWIKADEEVVAWTWMAREGVEETLMGLESSQTAGGELAAAEVFARALGLVLKHQRLMEAHRNE